MKRIFYLAVAVVLSLAVDRNEATADSFDCTHPTLAVARAVCGDQALRAADATESETFDTTMLAALDRPRLRQEEEAWFNLEVLTNEWYAEHGSPIDTAKLLATYQHRTDALRQATQRWHDLRRPTPGAQLTTECVALPYPQTEGCQVQAFKPVEGDPSLRYQLQTYRQPVPHSTAVVFVSAATGGDDWLPIAVASSEQVNFTAPQAIASPAGKLLLIPGSSVDNAEENASALYRFTAGSLEDIDSTSWLASLGAKLPPGLETSHGIVADYAKMVAVATLARPGDSSCCPTGGRATIKLAIEDSAVTVKTLRIEAPARSNE